MAPHFPLDTNQPLHPSNDVTSRFERIRQRPVALEVRALGKRFDAINAHREVLRALNFQVHQREFVCVIGPSGCGKSTLIRMLAGLEHPTAGEILIDGKPVNAPGPDRGMVFQNYSLFPWLTVKGNVMFGPKMRGQGNDLAARDAMTWLDLVGLSQHADAYPYQLSGGMRQRVAIARALVNNPRILLMDEPFGALDARTRVKMQAHLLDIWKNVDITIVLITHDLDEAIYLADRIIVLRADPGEIQEVIEVTVPRPRLPSHMSSEVFLTTRRRLEALIHEPGAQDDGDPPVKSHLIRLTDINDNVE